MLLVWSLSWVSGCNARPEEEVSHQDPYRHVVGGRYEVVSHQLDAYGIRDSSNVGPATSVAVIPAPGIGGREVAFKAHIDPGRRFTVQSAWRRFTLSGPVVFYRIAWDDEAGAAAVPVEIDLDPENSGGDGELNPAIYRRLSHVDAPG